jgi:hypothetical protein
LICAASVSVCALSNGTTYHHTGDMEASMTAPPRAGERDGAASGPGRKRADPLLAILVAVDLLLFTGGATAHAGVGIPDALR